MWKIKSTFSNINSFTINQFFFAFVMSENEIQIFDLKTQKLMISKKGIFGSGSLHFVDQFLIWCDGDEESTAIKLNDGTANKINGAFYFLEKDLSGTGFFAKVRTPEKKIF
jgi:hypothetical protein